jgi:hypothetical protein
MTPWDDTLSNDGSMSIEIVNKYHQTAAEFCRKLSREERYEKAVCILEKLPSQKQVSRKTQLDQVLFENLSQIKDRKFKGKHFELFHRYVNSEVAFSQMDMALVQAAFFASFTAFPDDFGAQHATDAELLAFVHVWRVIGYYLGVEDQYNLARLETIGETRALLIELGNEIVIPSFLHLNSISLRMLRSFSEAFNIDYHLAMYRHAYAHGYEMKLLWSHFSIRQKSFYYVAKLVEFVYCNIPMIKRYINNIYKKYSNKMYEQRKCDILLQTKKPTTSQ